MQHVKEIEDLIGKSDTLISEVELQMDRIETVMSEKDEEIRSLRADNLRLSQANEKSNQQSRKMLSPSMRLCGEIDGSSSNILQPPNDVVDATSAVKELRRQLEESRTTTLHNQNMLNGVPIQPHRKGEPNKQGFPR